MKLFNLALPSACLFTFSLVFASLPPAMAADATTEETNTYQSSFDDYKPLADDSLADWKTINTQSSGSGHAGHSMHGMQHQMSPEQMANMPVPANEKTPAMKGMDHSQMKRDNAMAPMEGMDHSKMSGMDHGEMKAMPSNEKPAMQHMDHTQMQGMSQGKMAQTHDHAMPTMEGMDHSKMTATEPMSGETTQHEHANEQSQEHSEMATTSAKPTVEVTRQSQHFQIIPNLHPMVVHFPIALTFIAFLLSLAAYMLPRHAVSAQLAAAGHLTLWIAALSAATAVLFGWLAFNSVNHDDAGHAAMLLHRAWAIPTAVGLVLLASWDAWKHRVNELMSLPMLILLFVLSGSIAVTGWLGGEVVYRHGIGVLALPSNEASEHSLHHEHGGKDAAEHAHVMSEATADKNSDEHTEHYHDDEKGESHEH